MREMMAIRPYVFCLILLTPLLITGESRDALVAFMRTILPHSVRRMDLESIGHGILFTIIPLILFRFKMKALDIAATVIGLAFFTELLQYFIPERNPTLKDVVIDVVSGFSVILAVLLLVFLKNSREKRLKNSDSC